MTRASLSRRHFLRGSAALGAATALGACRADRDPDGEAAAADSTPSPPSPAPSGPLVLVTLAGGNDALNTVVPIEDSTYRAQRGELALDPATTLSIGEGFALHPALVRTKALWDSQCLAVVHGVGFAGLDRSHFHCMDIWQAADAEDLSTGWLGRWLDLVGDDPLDVIAVGRSLPLLARGERRSAAVVPAGPFALPGDSTLHAQLASVAAGEYDGLRAATARSTGDLLAVVDRVAPVLESSTADDTLAGSLTTVGTLIDAGMPTRAYAVGLGGFDTHATQAATHEALLAELDAALGDFLDARADKPVTVLVYSEFGRRVAANGSAGTDHGSAGTVLLAGNVVAGHHGDPPPLDDLIEGDLRTTVDFRSVYASVIGGVLGTDPADVIADAPEPLDLV